MALVVPLQYQLSPSIKPLLRNFTVPFFGQILALVSGCKNSQSLLLRWRDCIVTVCYYAQAGQLVPNRPRAVLTSAGFPLFDNIGATLACAATPVTIPNKLVSRCETMCCISTQLWYDCFFFT
jgi:hypothetical protein